MRRFVLLTVAVLGLITLFAAARSSWMLAWAVAHDLIRPEARPLTPWLGASPEASAILIPHPHGTARALLVRPRGGRARAALVLVHGMVATGEEDWRLRRLADTLASGGFTVLVPAVPGLKRGAIVEGDIDVVAAALTHLQSKVEGVEPSRVGVVGISVGGGPALAAAAASPSKVAFAGAFGGYYDLVEVLKGLVEAGKSLEGELVSTDRWTFFASNAHLASDPADRALLLGLAALPPAERAGKMAAARKRLSPAGRAILELMTTDELKRIESIVERAGPAITSLRKALSPRYYAERLTMKLFLAHGRPDPIIPHTETLRLAAALPAGPKPTVALLPLFGHVGARPAEATSENRLQALMRFHRLLTALLAQRP